MPILNHIHNKAKTEEPWNFDWCLYPNSMSDPNNCIGYFDVKSAEEFYARMYDLVSPTTVINGDITHFLDKTNLAKDVNGNAVALDGSEGDVCVSIPLLYFGVLENKGKEIDFRISNTPFEGCVNAHTYNGQKRKYIHLGMFQMPETAVTIDGKSTKACSVFSETYKPWVKCGYNTVLAEAEARGENYCMMSYLAWALYQQMVMYASGTLDSQGIVADNVSSSFSNTVGKAGMLTAKGKFGKYWGESLIASMTSAMYLFLANPWGNVNVMLGGIKLANSKYNVCTDMKYARGVKVYDALPTTGWTQVDATFPVSDTDEKFNTTFAGESVAPFLPTDFDNGGSESTYFCDTQQVAYYNDNTKQCMSVGGNWGSSGQHAGVFSFRLSCGNEAIFGGLGSRIMIFDNEVVE